jgi:hypothetical protein
MHRDAAGSTLCDVQLNIVESGISLAIELTELGWEFSG